MSQYLTKFALFKKNIWIKYMNKKSCELRKLQKLSIEIVDLGLTMDS